MNQKRTLNYHQAWVVAQLRDLQIDEIPKRDDYDAYRTRVSLYETEVLDSLFDYVGHISSSFNDDSFSFKRTKDYIECINKSRMVKTILPTSLSGAEKHCVAFYYDEDGTYHVLETGFADSMATIQGTIAATGLAETPRTSPVVAKILERYSEKELIAIANGKDDTPLSSEASIEFSGKWFKWMQMTDLHLGSKFTRPDDIISAFKFARREGCEMITVAGDVFEGMSARQGHIYELSHIGYSSQLDHGREVFSYSELPTYAISGNHDEWFIKSNGAYIVKQLAESIPNMTYLGENYGSLSLNGAKYELFHGLDSGGAYAMSYRVQKIIEAYEGGSKPQILGTGHDHKAGYFFIRNVHAFLGGCMQTQSDWMRQTRKAAMKSFWVIEALIEAGEVKRLKMELIPFYK